MLIGEMAARRATLLFLLIATAADALSTPRLSVQRASAQCVSSQRSCVVDPRTSVQWARDTGRRCASLMMVDEQPEKEETKSKGFFPPPPDQGGYDAPDFEFDAVTITAILGAAIAFQFFVLGNL